MDASTIAQEASEQRHRLAQSLRHMIDEGEQLLHSAQTSGAERLSTVHDKLERELRQARSELEALSETATHNVRRAAHATDSAVHAHPYAAVGLASAVGLVLGMLIGRRN